MRGRDSVQTGLPPEGVQARLHRHARRRRELQEAQDRLHARQEGHTGHGFAGG